MLQYSVFLLLGYLASYANCIKEGEYVGAKLEDIRKEALALVQLTQHTQPGEELRAIPGLLNFTCPGTISSLLLIAADLQDANSSITFITLSPIHQPGHLLKAIKIDDREINKKELELVTQSSSGRNISLYRVHFSPPLEIKVGDLLGIGEGGIALQYAYGQGPENYVIRGFNRHKRAYEYIRSPIPVRDLPLMALEKYNCGMCGSTCVQDQLIVPSDLTTLLLTNTNAMVEAPFLGYHNISELYKRSRFSPLFRSPTVSPLLRFTNDGSITKWSLNGYPNPKQIPQLEIWRRNVTESGQMVYERVEGVRTPIKQATKFNKHTYYYIQEIAFREGDVLGVSYNGSKRIALGEIELNTDISNSGSGSYDTSTATTDRIEQGAKGVLQISLSIDLDVSDSDIESEKEDREVAEPVIQTREIFNETHTESEHSAILQFSIPYSGHLRRWLFAAHLVQSLTSFTDNLQLQVWRAVPNQKMKMFRLVHSTNITLFQEDMQGEHLGTWEITLSEPLPVEAGDILGFHQPPAELHMAMQAATTVSAHRLSVLNTYPYVLTRLMSNSTETRVPLMAAEIIQSTVPNQSPTGTPTAEVHEDQSVQSSRNNTVLIASTVSAVVGGILALGIILVLLYSCRRLHLKTKQLKSSSLMQRRPSEASNVYLRSLSTSSADSDNGIASPTATKAFF